MKFKFSVVILTILCHVSLCKSSSPVVKGFSIPAKTSLPFTYCIDYTKVPDVPSNLNRLRESPPDLFHIGYHIPFKAALGPTYGHELYTNDILKPQDIGREVDRVQTLIQRIKNTGVDFLIPYVYTMAFFGLPDQRTGFFNFYDHWDDYREFGLGPKPPADPSLWSQVRRPDQLEGEDIELIIDTLEIYQAIVLEIE